MQANQEQKIELTILKVASRIKMGAINHFPPTVCGIKYFLGNIIDLCVPKKMYTIYLQSRFQNGNQILF